MSYADSKKLPPTIEKIDGDVKFYSISCMYDFFSPRTKKIENWSFGFRNGGAETEICESTGSKVKIFDGRPGAKEKYDIFARIMNTHETEEGDPKWAELLTEHWILPDSTTFSSTLPSQFAGMIDISGNSTNLSAMDTKVIDRLDICKIDYDTFTTNCVYSILNSGYRPGLFFINWPEHPDSSNETMICAGHLQTCGYRLLKSSGNYFTYMFIDDCMYEVCSWDKSDSPNPMFQEYARGLAATIKASHQQKESFSTFQEKETKE